jgi:hypothetical protein
MERVEGPARIHEEGVGSLDIWPLPSAELFIERLLRWLFEEHWQEIIFGPLLQGSAWEMRAEAPPRLLLSDGYLTTDLGTSHFHLCIGPHIGDADSPTPPALARRRRTNRVELFRRINRDGTPDTWGLRLFSGGGDQQMTVLFPNPFVSEDATFTVPPDWSRLRLWNDVRREFLDIGPDEFDRSGQRMVYP